MEQGKDPSVQFKSFKRREKEDGGQTIMLNLAPEQVGVLIEALQSVTNERGAKLTVNVTKRTTHDGSRTFDSAYAFISGIAEPRAGGFGGGAGRKRSFVPKKGHAAAAGVLGKQVD